MENKKSVLKFREDGTFRVVMMSDLQESPNTIPVPCVHWKYFWTNVIPIWLFWAETIATALKSKTNRTAARTVQQS